MKMLAKALVATATSLTASVAFAFPVNLTSVSGSFENAVGGSNVNGEGTSQIRWGYSSGAGQSGYNFNGTSPLPQTILDSDAFVLGSLTHINKPVTGDGITGVDLAVNLGFDGFGDNGSSSGTFVFAHDETPNTAPPPTRARPSGTPPLASIFTSFWATNWPMPSFIRLPERITWGVYPSSSALFVR